MSKANIDANEILQAYRILRNKFDIEKTGLKMTFTKVAETPVTDSVIPAPKACASCGGSGLWKWKDKPNYPCFNCDGTGVHMSVLEKIAKFKIKHPRTVEWMLKGKGGFAKSLNRQFQKNGTLTPKQLAVIDKQL